MADLGWLRTFGRNRPTQPTPTTTSSLAHLSSNPAETSVLTPVSIPASELLPPPTPPARTPESSPNKHRFRSFDSLRRVSSNILNPSGSNNNSDKHGHNHGRSYSLFPYQNNNNNNGNKTPNSSNHHPHQRPASSLWTPAPIGALPLAELDPDQDKDGGLRRVLVGRRGEASAWHNPSLMQMVETLRAVMIGKHDALDGIPVVYNSYVLSLIEGFAHITERLESCQVELDELKSLREMELEQFRAISEEWMQREEAYKAEIKRLELVLAKESKDGVASVALARHESLVDRSGTKPFKARLERMSNSHERVDWITEDTCGNLDTSSVGSTVPGKQYSVLSELPRRMDQNRDVRISRAVERQERTTQPFPQDQRRQASTHGDESSSPGTRRRQSLQKMPPNNGQHSYPAEHGASLHHSPPSPNKYAGDDAESTTSDETMSTAEESLGQSEMDGGVDMLKAQPDQFIESRSQLRTASAEAGSISSPAKQQRHRRTAIRLRIRPSKNEPLDSLGLHSDADTNKMETNFGVDGEEQDVSPGPQDYSPPWRSYRGFSSASTRIRRQTGHRKYSFDKGDDEILPVTSPTIVRRGYDSPPSGGATANMETHDYAGGNLNKLSARLVPAEKGLHCVQGQVHSQPGDERFQHRRPSMVAPSTSTGSVVWVGNVTDRAKHQTVAEKGRDVDAGCGGVTGGPSLPNITISPVSEDDGVGSPGLKEGSTERRNSRETLKLRRQSQDQCPSSASSNNPVSTGGCGDEDPARIAAKRAVARQGGTKL